MSNKHTLLKNWNVGEIRSYAGYNYQNVGFGYVFNIELQKKVKLKKLKSEGIIND